MSRWRSVNPAKYAPKSNALGDMLEGFASVYVPAVMKQKELDEKREYEEALERKKKNAAAAKAAAEQDKKDKKLAKDAKALAFKYTGTNDNSDAVLYFTQQLQLFDGDVGDVISTADSMVEKGQLKFTSQQFEEEITRVDPTKAPPVRLDSIGSYTSTSVGQSEGESRPLTSLDLNRISSYKDDEDKSDTAKANAVVAEQMKANFGDQQLESSETETVTGTQYGVEITPAGEVPDELDFGRLETLDSIELYEQEISAGRVTLSEEDRKLITARKESLENKSLRAVVQDAYKDLDNAKAILQTEIQLGETDTDKHKILKATVEGIENNQKPWEAFTKPENIAGKPLSELRQNKRLAVALGAKEDDLAMLNTEIVTLSKAENDAPIKWSDIKSKTDAAGLAKELQDKGRTDDAKAVTEYADALFAPEPLSLIELDKLSDTALAGLRSTVKDENYLATINQVITTKQNAKDIQEAEDITNEGIQFRKELVGADETKLRDIANSPQFDNLTKITARAILTGRSPAPFKIEDYDDIDDLDVLKIARDQAPDDSPKKAQLTTLIKAREAAETGKMPKLNLDGGFFVTSYIDDENQLVVATTAPSDQGIYDIDNMRLVPQDKIQNNENMKMLDTIADAVAQAQDKTLKPITESRRQMAFMLRSADRLEKFVNPEMGGNPAILTTVGGDITRVVNRLGNEYNALNQLFLKGASNEEVFRYIEGEAANYETLAGLSSQFQAELLKHAYLYATTVLEQRGTGLSNQDFKQALEIVKAGSSYTTFSNNLRSQSRQAIAKVNDLVSDLDDTNIQIMVLDRLDPSGDLTAGYKMSAEEFLDNRNLTNMVTWANGEAKEIKLDPPPEGGDGGTPKTVGQNISDFKNSADFADIQTQMNNLSKAGNTTSLNRALEIYSKQSGIPIDILKKDVFNLGSEGN